MRNECEWFDHGADIGTRGLGATEAATFEMAALALAAVITDPRRVEPRDEVSLRCHGAGRALSRHAATKRWGGRKIVDELAGRGILIRTPSLRGVAEEAPLAYKDVSAVVDSADKAGLAKKGARQEPMVCIKG